MARRLENYQSSMSEFIDENQDQLLNMKSLKDKLREQNDARIQNYNEIKKDQRSFRERTVRLETNLN